MQKLLDAGTRPSIHRFSAAVVAAELAGNDGSSDPARAALRIVAKLRASLGTLVGPAGFEVLLSRSLVLARREDPMLERVTAAGGNLVGLSASDRESAERETVALLSHFIELVAVLVGEDVAARLVRGVWPDVRP
ncbi:MAG TPA: hypothetical protein VN894_04400 [Polyangiaceae bacterium]|nr:hypothetical protein [Polyangiaceae bacterium]